VRRSPFVVWVRRKSKSTRSDVHTQPRPRSDHASPHRARRDPLVRSGCDPRILQRAVRLDLSQQGVYPGYTFVDTGVPDALYTAISPLQGDGDLVTFFVGVDDMDAVLERTKALGGRVVQEPVSIPGVSFALIADPQGHIVGLAQQT
jgi:uncharacterized protein